MDKEAVMRNDWLYLIFYFQDLKGNLWNILWQVCEPNGVIHRDTEGTEGLLPAERDSIGCVSYTLLQHGWKILWGKGKQRQNSDSVASGLLTGEKPGFSNDYISIIFKNRERKSALCWNMNFLLNWSVCKLLCPASLWCSVPANFNAFGVFPRETSILLFYWAAMVK